MRVGDGRWLMVVMTVLLGAGCAGPAKTVDAEDQGPAREDLAAREGGAAEVLGPEILSEIPSDELPRLPPGKSFATRYAAGVALVDITPTETGLHMGGFGLCPGKPEACKFSQGTHDPLMLHAAAIADTVSGEVVILVGMDSVGLIKADIVAIQQAVPASFAQAHKVLLEGERVVITASHTHLAPDTVGLYGPMLDEVREEEEYIAFVREQALAAALNAFGELADSHLSWGVGSAPTNSLDRDHVDQAVLALRAATPSDETIFTLVRWPGHPTWYGYDSNALSADWVGTMRLRLEQELGGIALFLNGPIGSIYVEPVEDCQADDAFPNGWRDPDNAPEDFAQVACIGYRVAEQAIAGLANGTPLAESGLRVRFAEFDFHPTNFVLTTLLSLSAIPWEPVDTNDPESMIRSRFSWITLGDIDLLTTPGEAFPSFAAHATALLTAAGHPNSFVLGLAQDWMGYLLAQSQWDQDDLSYHRTISPGPGVEPAYLARLGEMIAQE